MTPHSYFEDLYRADPDRWDHWKDFCWWLDEYVIPGVERHIEDNACREQHCSDHLDIECPECGEVYYV